VNIIFMGTPTFALPTLDALATCEEHNLLAVYTRPDAKSGRGNKLRPTRVKVRAKELGLPVHTPKTLRDPQVVAELAAYDPDVIAVAAYGGILPADILSIPKIGCLNVHGSLLPRWRGAAPIQRAILDGDDIAGVCIMQMEEGLDTGLYHTVGSVVIGNKTTDELTEQLGQMGAEGLLEALAQIEDGTYTWTEQDESQATYADKVSKDETLLRPGLTNREFLRRVQASSHRAPSRCVVCGKRIAVIRAHPANTVLPQGAVVLERKHIFLGLKGRAVELDVVQPESKREMQAKQWIAGLHNVEDLTWNVLPEYYHKLPVYG
jgi:methionyl-tRNA formyltransferase